MPCYSKPPRLIFSYPNGTYGRKDSSSNAPTPGEINQAKPGMCLILNPAPTISRLGTPGNHVGKSYRLRESNPDVLKDKGFWDLLVYQFRQDGKSKSTQRTENPAAIRWTTEPGIKNNNVLRNTNRTDYTKTIRIMVHTMTDCNRWIARRQSQGAITKAKTETPQSLKPADHPIHTIMSINVMQKYKS